jgi:hypothetical protein
MWQSTYMEELRMAKSGHLSSENIVSFLDVGETLTKTQYDAYVSEQGESPQAYLSSPNNLPLESPEAMLGNEFDLDQPQFWDDNTSKK